MNIKIIPPLRQECRERVIALHCSGAGASQWRHLSEALGGRYHMAAPEHYGSEATGPWTGEHAFTLADEAARAIALIDESNDKVHLVGHSYGGGVALNVALARPERIASMALYEPSAFHLLRQMGEAGAAAFAEIAGVARHMCRGIITGDHRGAIVAFVDYWSGEGAWEGLRPHVQNALIRWAPKGPLDFHALFEEPTPAHAYGALRCPVLILRGEHALAPTRLIAEGLTALLPEGRLVTVAGAGHMGPLTNGPEVAALITHHIAAVDSEVRFRRRWRSRRLAHMFGVTPRPQEAVS
jgi:pimeloyl-ACP methyl ester carboxylesterase